MWHTKSLQENTEDNPWQICLWILKELYVIELKFKAGPLHEDLIYQATFHMLMKYEAMCFG